MKPEADQILNFSAMKIIADFAPALGTQYGQGMAQVVAVLLMMAAQEYDRAADIRLAENEDMRGLFRELAPRICDTDLRGELEKVAATRDTSLRISALNDSNAMLRRLLIRLHEAAEQASDRALDRRILKLYRDMAGWRELHLPPVKPAS
jgi:hypothetical protein